jgi:hypothetical protein
MFDPSDVGWLLRVVAVMGVIALALAVCAKLLEAKYLRDMSSDADASGASSRTPHANYHAQGLAHASVNWGVSIFFTGVSFVLLVDADDDGRGLVSAIIAMVFAIVFFVESRRSRSDMLEQTRLLRAEEDERRRSEEHLAMVQLISEGADRDKILMELLRQQGSPLALQPSSQPPGQPRGT